MVDALDGGVAGGVKADGIVRAADVVVDGGGNAHHLQPHPRICRLPGQGQRPPEGAVAADGHDAVQPQQLAGPDGFLPARLIHELLAAGRIEDGAAPVDDVADTAAVQPDKVTGDQPAPPPADTDTLNPPANRRADHSPNCRIHARRIAAAGQHTDPLDFIAHNKTSSYFHSRRSRGQSFFFSTPLCHHSNGMSRNRGNRSIVAPSNFPLLGTKIFAAKNLNFLLTSGKCSCIMSKLS